MLGESIGVFVDPAGSPVHKTVVLQPGVADSLQLEADDILGRLTRAPIRAVVEEQLLPPGQKSDCSGLVGTLEMAPPVAFRRME